MNVGAGLFIVGAILIVVAVGAFAYGELVSWEISENTDEWISQAQGATTPEQKAMFLEKARAGYEKYNLTSGATTVWFAGPTDDISVQMQNLNDTIKYAHEVEKIPKGNQEAFENAYTILQDKVNSLYIEGTDVYMIKNGLWFLGIISLLSFIFGCVFVVLGIAISD